MNTAQERRVLEILSRVATALEDISEILTSQQDLLLALHGADEESTDEG